jgi:nitrate reductase / nitrite oxidoreductase, alpha subunit
MSMGHVILKEFFVDRTTPYFSDYVKRYTDLPFLVTLTERGGDWLPGKFLTAADLGDTGEGASSKTVLLDADANPVVPNGSLGHRFTPSGEGNWNLDLHRVDPLLTLHGSHSDVTTVQLPRFDGDRPGVLTRGVPTRIVAGQRVTTVFDLLLAQYGVHRDGLPGDWPAHYGDAAQPYVRPRTSRTMSSGTCHRGSAVCCRCTRRWN